MATSAWCSSQPGRNLPLIDCPQCQVPVIKCKSQKNNIYYRCSNKCGKFWFEDAYELYLRDYHTNKLENAVGTGTGSVRVVQELADMRVKIQNLKIKMKDLQDEVRKGKNGIVLDNAAMVVVVVVVVAMFVTLLLAIVWKK